MKFAVFGYALLCAVPFASNAAIPYYPFVAAGRDPLTAVFEGTPSTTGLNQINLDAAAPAYLNALHLPGGTAAGAVTMTSLPKDVPALVGLAIHVSDTAGPSHSLANLNDPALNDLIYDVNHLGVGGDLVVTAYPYNSAPAEYANAQILLSTGEASLGGQPFDILLVGTNPQQPIGGRMYWSSNFSTTVNNIDGITAIGITDIGALPEPSTLVFLPLLAVFRRRRC